MIILATTVRKDNNIAINHQGSMPVKWPGQGRFILDGTTSAHLYQEYIPTDSLPQLFNPDCNYVQSANQRPTYSNYSYYYNGNYSETRANRIEQLLNGAQQMDIDAMKAMQLDNTNSFTVTALPVLLTAVNDTLLSNEQKLSLDKLKTWNGSYDYDNDVARLYEQWWQNIRSTTWDELRNYRYYIKAPNDEVLLDMMMNDPGNAYFDMQETRKKEVASDIITQAFIAAFADVKQLGKEGKVKWSDFHTVNLMHLTNLPALSRVNLPAAGQQGALNAMSRNWGPSWRMIVELGNRPQAVGIFPGGQSGNPVGKNYDNFIDNWNKDSYYQLKYFISDLEASQQCTGVWKFVK